MKGSPAPILRANQQERGNGTYTMGRQKARALYCSFRTRLRGFAQNGGTGVGFEFGVGWQLAM